MYIIKNALKSISRSKGRNLLIGIIVLVISTASCIGLSIRNAAEEARVATLEGITITAQISVDRNAMMSNVMGNMGGGSERPSFDKDSFTSMMSGLEGLSLEEQEEYAKLETVKSFYYTVSVSMNGADIIYAEGSESVTLEPVSSRGSSGSKNDKEDSSDEGISEDSGFLMGDMGGMPGMGGGMPGFQMQLIRYI